MAKRKSDRKTYEVMLFGTLPCSAKLTTPELDSPEEAAEWAQEHWSEADWDGADYSSPDGCTIEVGEVKADGR